MSNTYIFYHLLVTNSNSLLLKKIRYTMLKQINYDAYCKKRRLFDTSNLSNISYYGANWA